MKRNALLIGNSQGMADEKRDMVNFPNFLMGRYGGAWKTGSNGEITTQKNPSLADILGEKGNEETVYDSEPIQLDPREISIFDCCRALCNYTKEREVLNEWRLFLSPIRLIPYNLLKYAKSITGSYGLVGNVHVDATHAIFTEVMIKRNAYQEPMVSLSKCLTSQQLIISILP